ncbi:MAG: hypothetical protein ACRD2P_15135 [Terriglobia bacterium]
METNAGETYRPQDERLLALQRLLESRTLSNSEAIRRVLKYIVEVSVSGHSKDIKEYTIATEALKCPEDFDPKADNKVRVQMQRLRKKLEEYYSGEGAHDPLRILIPIGHYMPLFEPCFSRENASKDSDKASLPVATPAFLRNNVTSFLRGLKGFILILVISIVALGLSVFRRPVARARSTAGKTALPASLACLWSPFVSNPKPPLIIYSNAFFLMSKQGDLYRYFAAAAHSLPLGAKVPSLAGLERTGPMPSGVGPLYYFDAYTGTGEVVAAARIGQLLSQEDENFDIERDGVVSYEDIRGSNVIFLGASLEDSILRTLPIRADLVFEEASQSEFVGSLEIRDRHPGPGQPSIYRLQRDQKTQALDGEYALISLLPGVMPGHYIVVLAGISTIGTEAAAEFATSKDCMGTIARVIGSPPGKAQAPPYFQVLLHVQIRDGEGAKTSCLLVRKLPFQPQAALSLRQDAAAPN